MVWAPGDPWPHPGHPAATPGGVAHPAWGGYIRFWLLAEIESGYPFTLGPSANDRLNAGNVLTDASFVLYGDPGAGVDPRNLPTSSGLWIDLTCDLVDCEIRGGSSAGAGILSNVEAGTLTATLYDPTGKYDPANPDTPYALGGRSRLVPGVRVLALCEIVTDPAATPPALRQQLLFVGTTDSWSEEWSKEPSDRRGKLQATDYTKNFVKLDRDEQSPQGAGESVAARMQRIAGYFGFNLPTQQTLPGDVTHTLQATTLAQSAWELMNRAITDELGFLSVRPMVWSTVELVLPGLEWWGRQIWTDKTGPQLNVGCGGAGFYDIVTDATPAAIDATLINTVFAARTGGTTQTAANPASVNRWGEQSYQRTDLGLNDDSQTADWAASVVDFSANPRSGLEQVRLVPAIGEPSWTVWDDVVFPPLVRTQVRVVYESDLFDYVVDVTVRIVGYTHHLSADEWSIEWRTVSADISAGATVLHMGPDALDRLDANNVLA